MLPTPAGRPSLPEQDDGDQDEDLGHDEEEGLQRLHERDDPEVQAAQGHADVVHGATVVGAGVHLGQVAHCQLGVPRRVLDAVAGGGVCLGLDQLLGGPRVERCTEMTLRSGLLLLVHQLLENRL